MAAKFVAPAKSLQGTPRIPGDKSISHRAAIFSMLAEGKTRITGFLKAEDCLNTLKACQQLGAQVQWQGDELTIQGCGPHGLKAPQKMIDCGNSGTGVRLLSGVLAGQAFTSTITGDEQVQRRPMNRIIKPLTLMGAKINSQLEGRCPLQIQGGNLKAIQYESPVASAQVKSCVLLAGLFAQGTTSIQLPAGSRQHTENMLRYFGVDLERREVSGGLEYVAVQGGSVLQGCEVQVPADLSSAAFFLVAAGLLSGSKLSLQHLGMGEGRRGVLSALLDMGADLKNLSAERVVSGEPIADLFVTGHGSLKSIHLGGPKIAELIDEIPILAVAAAMAEGETLIQDAGELRVKETDRIHVLAAELNKIGVAIEELPDGMRIHGSGGERILGGEADSHGDHRLAMSLAVAGLVSRNGVRVNNPECVNTSFPGFWEILEEVVVR